MRVRARESLFAAAATFGLAGCASLSEQECRGEDWYQVGLEDGAAGSLPGRVEAHGKACAAYGIAADAAQYELGRLDGLVHFCTASNGFDVGRRGSTYSGACPEDREEGFVRGYRLGRGFHDVDVRLARIEADIRSYRSRLSDPELDENQVQRLRSVLRGLEFDRSRLESDRRRLEWELRALQRQLPRRPAIDG